MCIGYEKWFKAGVLLPQYPFSSAGLLFPALRHHYGNDNGPDHLQVWGTPG